MFLVLVLTLVLYLLFVWKAGKTYPLLYLSLLVYFIQYIFSVYLIYNFYPELRREMTISQDQLFDYLVPALIFLFGVVFLFNLSVNFSSHFKKFSSKNASQFAYLLL